MTKKPVKRIQKKHLAEELSDTRISLPKRYIKKVMGSDNFLSLLKYELAILLLSDLPGGLGFLLRKHFYRLIFRKIGKNVVFGKGITLRYPDYISIGNRVGIDDYVLLDASGSGDIGIIIKNDVIISRNCVVQGKTGPVIIEDKANIGCNTIISSATGIYIGSSVLIAGNSYIGGGRYIHEKIDIPMTNQGFYSKGEVVIENDVLLGAGTIVLDGTKIRKGTIVGAGAVVNEDLPAYVIAGGIPAKILKKRY